MQGAQKAKVTIAYLYRPRYYLMDGGMEISWDILPTLNQPNLPRAALVLFPKEQVIETELGGYDARGFELGGWTLDVHHSYDPLNRRLTMGSGEVRDVDPSDVLVLERFAGQLLPPGFGGDGGPARDALLNKPDGLAVDAEGAVFISDRDNQRVRRVDPDGTIETVAGTGTYGYSGDGGPATSAKLSGPRGLAIGPDGTLYIADEGANRIRHVKANGDIETVAGGGSPADGLGDGGPATAARLSLPTGIAVSPAGVIYIADRGHQRVRIVGTSGHITTVAGDGNAGSSGDGEVAATARLRNPTAVALAADGELFISDTGNGKVRRVAPDGQISTVAGGGSPADGVGDGGPATAARLAPAGLATAPDDTVVVVDTANSRVRSIQPGGTILSVAGGSLDGHTEGLPATGSVLTQPAGVAVSPDGATFVSDRATEQVKRVRPLLGGFSDSDILIASEDGDEIYQFNGDGRHERTLEALTGGVRYEFSYDADGRLVDVSDPQGSLLEVERTAAGAPTALVARNGEQTGITLDSNGYLMALDYPGDGTIGLEDDADGLLTKFTEPEGHEHEYGYDELGRLERDAGPGGSELELARTILPNGHEVTVTSKEGREWKFRDEDLPTGDNSMTVTDAAGAQSVF